MYLICKGAKVHDQIKTKRKERENLDLERKGLVIKENIIGLWSLVNQVESYVRSESN